ncbi:MAG: hypothetical protein GYA24_17805 [Candidatus Lokiarchaeota archaeon]|nr:hypothetical protein [Candidatus Lokiarchaeota archaeon]
MRVRAFMVKTAQFKASAEEGKYSDAYKREGAALLVHPDDLATWALRDGMHVTCTNPASGRSTILAIKPARNTCKGMVAFNESPWTRCLVENNGRIAELVIEPSTAEISPLEQVLTSQGSGGA